MGLAVSRVQGIPNRHEFWSHMDYDVSPCSLGNGLTELQRGKRLNSTGWSNFFEYEFRFEFTPTSMVTYVDDVEELSITGQFSDGRVCFYNFSQESVRYSAFTMETLPTETPTSAPTVTTPAPNDTPMPTPPLPTVAPVACANVTIDFSTDADNVKLQSGTYVSEEWEAFGLLLSATGGFGTFPRLFDTANPSTIDAGDLDLGAPNRKCTPSGPGWGSGGNPGKEGENCDPLGNVLIIQEADDNADMSIPDDSGSGGSLYFDFVKQAVILYEIGFLDLPAKTTVTIVHVTSLGMEETVLRPIWLGNNAAQTETLNIENVEQVRVDFPASGAISFISFCRDQS